MSSRDGEDAETSFTYTPEDAPKTASTSVAAPNGAVTTYTTQYVYPPSSSLPQSLEYWVNGSRSHIIASFEYDGANRLRKVTEPTSGRSVTYSYDNLDRPIREVYNDGTFTSVEYSPCCNKPTRVIDRSGRLSEMHYDDLGRMDWFKNAQGQMHTMSHDENDNLIILTAPGNKKTEWQYDGLDRVKRKFYGYSNATEQWSYDKGRLVSTTNARGQTISYHYNEIDDLVMEESVAPRSSFPPLFEPNLIYGYDDLGNMTYAQRVNADTRTFTYDVLGRLTSDANGRDRVGYAYDGLGRLASTRLFMRQGGYIDTGYSYDNLGRLSSVDYYTGRFTYTYDDKSDRVTSPTRPDASRTTYTYEPGGMRRLTGMQNLSGAGALVSKFDYLYGDSNGSTKHRDSIVQMTRQISVGAPEVISYGYDEVNGVDLNTLDQLTRETVTRYGGLVSETRYAYDPSGNRTQRSYSGGGSSYTSTFSYDTLGLNQLMSVRTSGAFSHLSTFSYDADGNMTQEDGSDGSRKSYYWDSRGGLVFEQRGTTGGQVNSEVAMFRDAVGRLSGTRISGLSNGQWTIFHEQGRDRAFVGDQVLAEHDGLGNYISHSVRAGGAGGIGGLLMTSSATPGTQNHQFPHFDAQGNLNGITNGGPYATASGGPFLSRTYNGARK